MKIDKKIIKELSDYLDEFNLTELEYTEKDTKIKVSKNNISINNQNIRSSKSNLVSDQNTIIGNTVLYGATSGTLYASGQAGERFAVRNSGSFAIVEGCGAHGCEYMTGGTAIILGAVGDNFGAGMTGGMAFIYDEKNEFENFANPASIIWQPVETNYWKKFLEESIKDFLHKTSSKKAKKILENFKVELKKFKQVCPIEMLDKLDNPITLRSQNKKAG